MKDIVQVLSSLYGEGSAHACARDIGRAVDAVHGPAPAAGRGGFDQRDAVLITYPDMIQGGTSSSLETLRRFCVTRLAGAVSIVHLLPFFPSSSDDGFAVIDHRAVDPALGSWDDIERFRGDFRLMFDAVFNHVSSRSAWFQEFLHGDAEARWTFIVVPAGTDLSQAARPRAHPLVTPFHTASGEKLVWTTFSPDQVDLNFLASHDGIGVIPARGILRDEEIELLVQKVLARGGLVSYRANPDGSLSPYELNINYWDALADPDAGEDIGVRVDRFLAAHAIMLALRGVPALYFHSLVGSGGWPDGVALTGSNRSINRRKLDLEPLEAELADTGSQRARVFLGLTRLLAARRSCPCFHPQGGQRVLSIDPGVFALVRMSPGDENERVLCLHNIGDSERTVQANLGDVFGAPPYRLMDIVSGHRLALGHSTRVTLKPFQVSWLKAVTGVGVRDTVTGRPASRP